MAELSLPPQVADAFARSGTAESGGLNATPENEAIVVEYVRDHWRELLGDVKNVPSRGGRLRSSIMLVGAAAEELDAEVYMDFLDEYLDLYEKKIGIPEEVLQLQLMGGARKNYFLIVNYEDPRVRQLVLRAKKLVSEENVQFQELLDTILSGKLAENYLTNESDSNPPPETLPGIKLRTPFESQLKKLARDKERSEREAGRDALGDAGALSSSKGSQSEVASARGPYSIAALVGSLVVLLAAVWIYLRKQQKRLA